MNDDRYGVLLVRKVGHMLDSTFGYRGDRLPDVNDVIDVIDAVGNSFALRSTGSRRRSRFRFAQPSCSAHPEPAW